MEFETQAMHAAIAEARRGIAAGQSPFGAVIVGSADGVRLAAAHNRVWESCDPTAHAEVNAIRAAATALGRIDLSGFTMVCTCEPCPMCMAAVHWGRLDRLVFGAAIADAQRAGFHELTLPAATLLTIGGSTVRLQSGFLAAECAALFEEWKSAGRAHSY